MTNTAQDDTPKDRLVRQAELAELVGVSDSTLRRWVKAGLLPAPIRLGPTGHHKAWRESDIDAWFASLQPGTEAAV